MAPTNHIDRTDHHPHRPRRHRARRALAALLAGGIAATASVAAAVPAGAHATLPTAVFDPPSTAWASYRDLTSDQFADRFDAMVEKGYRVSDLEVDVVGGTYRVGAVFTRNTDGRAWRSLRDLTGNEFHAAWEQAREDGMRLIDQETYVVSGRRLFAGVWVANTEGLQWASYRGVTSEEFSERFARYRDAGYLPVDLEAYPTGDGPRYGAIWVENSEGLSWRLRRGLSSDEFGKVFEEYGKGFRMLDVEATDLDGKTNYGGIWVENRGGRHWRERRDLTAAEFGNWWARYRDEGYRLDDYEKYATPDGPRYAGIWRQNSARPSWSLRDDVDAVVDGYRDTHDVPGISVAIAKGGTFVYERGFGHADVDDDVWMHARSVHRLASVSKALAGTLLFDLEEQGLLDVDDPTRDHVGQLPAAHSHTLAQLAANRGCVATYPDGFVTSEQDHYDTALEAVEEFMGQDLVCTVGDYVYSTAGYTVLGAALESVLGQPVDDIVTDRLTGAYGLGTLRPEDRDADVPMRTRLYDRDDEDNVEIDRDDLSWKVLGGGLEGSVEDVARFGIRLLGGQILDDATMAAMWAPPGPGGNYAYGWNTGTHDGRPIMAKTGGQPGASSYIRVYPDEDVTIVVLTNRWDGKGADHQAVNLARAIADVVIDDLS